jgi:hypothetical protein
VDELAGRSKVRSEGRMPELVVIAQMDRTGPSLVIECLCALGIGKLEVENVLAICFILWLPKCAMGNDDRALNRQWCRSQPEAFPSAIADSCLFTSWQGSEHKRASRIDKREWGWVQTSKSGPVCILPFFPLKSVIPFSCWPKSECMMSMLVRKSLLPRLIEAGDPGFIGSYTRSSRTLL